MSVIGDARPTFLDNHRINPLAENYTNDLVKTVLSHFDVETTVIVQFTGQKTERTLGNVHDYGTFYFIRLHYPGQTLGTVAHELAHVIAKKRRGSQNHDNAFIHYHWRVLDYMEGMVNNWKKKK